MLTAPTNVDRVDLSPLEQNWLGVGRRLQAWSPKWHRSEYLWAAFALSVAASTASQLFGGQGVGFWMFVGLASSVSCGWMWMLARSLFRPQGTEGELWPLIAVLFVTALQFLRAAGIGFAGEVVAMIGSTFVVAGLVEAARWGMSAKTAPERRFAVIFAVLYSCLVATAMMWLDGAESPQAAQTLANCCAIFAVAGSWVAMRYRLRHPFAVAKLGPDAASTAAPKSVFQATEDDVALARSMEELILRRELYLTPSLKIADVAQMMNQPEYRLSRCVTGVLGHPNFNRFLNGLRIAKAKQMLIDEAHASQSILSIALDCGFGSIGPFNRAFKEDAGVTPSAWRRARLC